MMVMGMVMTIAPIVCGLKRNKVASPLPQTWIR